MTIQTDYYAILGLPRDATGEEIRRAYHQAARRLHPDINKEAGATDKFLRIQAAYEILADPVRRAAYDQASQGTAALLAGVEFETLFSRQALVTLQEPQLIYCLLDMTAPGDQQDNFTPRLNLSIVLDRSTSMRGDRLDTVKSATIEMSGLLNKDDYFSLITFSDRAEVVFPSRAGFSPANLTTAIQMVRASGATEIYQGLSAGLGEVHRQLRQNAINHIILITDGRTYGDEAACLQLAEQAANEGIGISCLGIGQDWNDTFLDELAAITGGASLYISSSSDFKKMFFDIFRGMGHTYAKDMRINLEMGQDVFLRDVFRLAPEPCPLEMRWPVQCGYVPTGEPLSLLFEFEAPPLFATRPVYKLAGGLIHYHLPEAEYPLRTERIQFTRPVESASDQAPPPERLVHALSRVSLYRLQERANQELANGQVDKASRHLHYLATHLLNAGERALGQAALNEAENLRDGQQISAAGRKKIKYGTRALMLPTPASDPTSYRSTSPEGGSS